MSKFGERLKLLREHKNMSQSDLAHVLNVVPSTIGMYEQGKREPSFEKMEQLAELFMVSLDYLMGRTDDKNRTFSPMTRDLLDLLHLSNEEIVNMRAAEIDGRPITKEELMQFIIQVRLLRQLEEQKQKQPPPTNPEE